MVDIHISNKSLYLIVSGFFLFVVMSVAVAFGTFSPSVMEHSAGEIELPTCGAGEVLTSDGAAFICQAVGMDSGNVVGGGAEYFNPGNPSTCENIWGVGVV